jgi:uncharacterized protein (TIGR02118 family)
MVSVSILYPDAPGERFDMEYYLERHMPISIGRLSAHPGFRGVSVERGVAAPQSGSPPVYVAICRFLFTSAEDFVAAFMPHADVLQADIANYTTIAPIIQFSDVAIVESRS